MRALVRQAVDALTDYAARPYVVGPDLHDAVRACKVLQPQFSTTICAWNEAGEAPTHNLARYLAAIDAIAGECLDSYLSFKVQDFQFSPQLTAALFERAQQRSVCLHFDSLALEDADRVFSAIERFRPCVRELGCTLPGRWRRSLGDAERAIALDLRVRVVTGQWADPDDPARDPRAGFLDVVERLCGRAKKVAVATHNPQLARRALEMLRASGTPVEMEVLYGLPLSRVLHVAQNVAVPVRIYLPYGRAWLPYALRQVRRNPRIALWLLRDLFSSSQLRLPTSAAVQP